MVCGTQYRKTIYDANKWKKKRTNITTSQKVKLVIWYGWWNQRTKIVFRLLYCISSLIVNLLSCTVSFFFFSSFYFSRLLSLFLSFPIQLWNDIFKARHRWSKREQSWTKKKSSSVESKDLLDRNADTYTHKRIFYCLWLKDCN